MADNPKAYDQAFKSLSDVDPRGLLDVFGVLPHGMEAEVEPLPRDIAARPLVIDAGYFVRPLGGEAFIAVFEALTSWKRDTGARLASYGAGLGHRYRMPIKVYVLPMAKYACPARTLRYGKAQWGDVFVAVKLSWIKPWEIDASVVLERKSATLDPWAVLFKMSRVQEYELANRLKKRPQDAGLFRILGGMRYRRDVRGWKKLLERFNQMLTRETMRESLAVQEWLQEGKFEGTRDALMTFIEERFPELRVRDEMNSITSLRVLRALLKTVAKAPDSATALRAIRKAALPR